MSDAAVTFLLDNLKQLLQYHANLISGARGELELLRRDLDQIKALLIDASKKRYKEEHFKNWEIQLREVIYEVEDTIDSCVTQAALVKDQNFVRRNLTTKRINLAQAVRRLREGNVKTVLDNATIELATLQIVDASDRSNEQTIDPRNKDPRQDNVVGFEDETEKLIGYILEESSGLDVISIIGMPGLGKTTVAWKIYTHPIIKHEFPTLIWVNVTQEFNKKDVLLTIMKKFTNQDMSSNTVVDLVASVKEKLERAKFLIFFDDVWTTDVWLEIHEFLPKNNNTGRVLITSRHENVGICASHSRDPHQLRFLTSEESWELLKLEVFGKIDDVPSELEEFGICIANKCKGLPLAVIVIGGILFDKFSIADNERKEEWQAISKNTDIYMTVEDKDNRIEKMISLSYTKLPYDLRDCFLYLGMFPEVTEIPAWKLTHLWIAEGFIKQKPNEKSLEETAQDNLKDLINRNLVMVDKLKSNGQVKTCRVHDTIREFCKNEAGKQNLFQEVRMSKQRVFEPQASVIEKCRRLCIHSYVKDFFLKKTTVPKARSFLSFSAPINLEKKDISSITDAFELLRVFDVKSIKFPKFPIQITQLVHLRYLTLSGDEFKMLPKAISKLWNLQTLMVETMSQTLKIEANIWKMIHLRHVKSKASIILDVDVGKGEGGENLQTLNRLSPQSCTRGVFNKAKNLKTLGIRGELDTLEDSKCLEKLDLLQKLKLLNHVLDKRASENPLRCLPCTFPRNLRFLTLSNTYLDWSYMSDTIGNIPNLQVLKLKDNAFSGDSWDTVSIGFLHLEFLYIARSDLMFWRIRGGDPLPRLKTLVLKNCEKLQSVPKDLVRKLDKLEMQRVTPFAVKSAKEVEVERKKIEEQQKIKRGGFKLIISPGDAQNLQL